MRSRRDLTIAWARSGAMALSGDPNAAPLGPPAELPERLQAVADSLARTTAVVGTEVRVDPLALLTERAALAGLSRHGTTSCGGATRLLAGCDGWLAVSLARVSDVELVPAWLDLDAGSIDAPAEPEPATDATWSVVAAAVGERAVGDLEARGAVLGLPVGALPDAPRASSLAPGPFAPFAALPVGATALGSAPKGSLSGLVVVDLSSLWAGPLCGRLLADAGAEVIKVESWSRPDGARSGPPAFFDLMNAGKASVALDLTEPDGRRQLVTLLSQSDVVIEASRPRALEQLGIDARQLSTTGPRVWVSITGHGRTGGSADRVAFGDDAAVAGGLVVWSQGQPYFCADAVADPCSGLVAAAAVVEAVGAGGRWLIDVAMADVAAHLAGPTLDAGGEDPFEPSRPAIRGQARELGADNARILGDRITPP